MRAKNTALWNFFYKAIWRNRAYLEKNKNLIYHYFEWYITYQEIAFDMDWCTVIIDTINRLFSSHSKHKMLLSTFVIFYYYIPSMQ